MADWQTVRFDPAYPEPLDPEIIPLCDALNAAGFVTESSCCGHGYAWPTVWFEHSSDERIESLARFVMNREQGDFMPFYSRFKKEILSDRYRWSLVIHLNDVYQATPRELALNMAVLALGQVTAAVNQWTGTPAGAQI